MCGIAGYWMADANDKSLLDALRLLRYRGPDETVHYLKDEIQLGLGMTRLAIVDVKNGHQPYVNETGSISAVFNGEIYNHVSLRRELELQGHRLSSTADGEVIVHLFEEHGTDFLQKLEGMFAIALFDSDQNLLLLARDRFGEKPLYYHVADGGVSFASSIRAIQSLTANRRTSIDDASVAVASRLGSSISPDSFLSSVCKVEPGGFVMISDDNQKKGFFWMPSGRKVSGQSRPKRAKRLQELDRLLSTSVRNRIPSEVPFGVFLSGGIDSALVARYAKESAQVVPAFTVRFAESTLDESELAKTTALALGLDLTVVDFDEHAVAKLWETLGTWMDEPNFDSSIFPTKHLSDEAAREIKVALTGDGGDELFGGYPKYFQMDLAFPLLARTPEKFVEVGGSFLDPHLAIRLRHLTQAAKKGRCHFASEINTSYFYQHEMSIQNQRCFESFVNELYTVDCSNLSWLDLDLRLYLEGILGKVDTATMSASIEARSPFLDSTLYHFARSLPKRDLYDWKETKILLRKLAALKLPESVTSAPKKGFTPSRRSMINVARSMGLGSAVGHGKSAAELMLGLKIEKSKWLSMLNDPLGKEDRKVWTILVLESWASTHSGFELRSSKAS